MKLNPGHHDSPQRRGLTSPEFRSGPKQTRGRDNCCTRLGQIRDLKADFITATNETLGALGRIVGRNGQASAAAWRGWIDSAA
jgi:hypothetical protein